MSKTEWESYLSGTHRPGRKRICLAGVKMNTCVSATLIDVRKVCYWIAIFEVELKPSDSRIVNFVTQRPHEIKRCTAILILCHLDEMGLPMLFWVNGFILSWRVLPTLA